MSWLTNGFATVNAVTADFAPRSPAHVVAAAVLGIEAGTMALAAVLYVTFGIIGDTGSAGLSFGIAAIAALAALGLGALARGLSRARRWAVTPSITWQVLQGFVAAYVISIGDVAPGAVALALAIVGLVALALVSRTYASRD